MEAFEITSLTSLDLSFNRLIEIPPEIKRLACLQSLNLSSNELVSLPLELGLLKNVNQLQISDNNSLPRELLMANESGLLMDMLKDDFLEVLSE